ncbi:substrate-binding domain-containing protein [Methylobacterium segetis]|uniref:substrate-binding domain-containing protein n=1 Tax=Methylobacterium segetis TaxID=2488750 RepID=UPI001049085E|nr:substrate-binding domain-containing protein [Methylobacterium segetis]
MTILRRRLLQSLPLLSLAAAKPQGTSDAVTTTDLVLNCDTAMGPALSRASDRFHEAAGVRVRVFPTSPGLLLPQLARKVQNDLLFTQDTIMQAATVAGLVAGTPAGPWSIRYVLAARRGVGDAALRGRITIPDRTPAADVDGPSVIRALHLGEQAVLGVLDTAEVAFLLERSEAEAGLLHASELAHHPSLEVVRTVPDAVVPPLAFQVAVTTLARRPNPQAFVDFLLSAAGRATLSAQGLESSA